ncbi:hypothetical protein JCM5350_000268 [Sporobolomyces pararoseus]
MSFNFEWPEFSESFYQDAREMLAQALNKGQKPPIIADRIEVKELNMGTIPPELEILEIGDLSTDRFRGIFRLTYTGDAYIVLQTKVQANPLNVPRPSLDILGSPRILFAAAPLVVPMTLRLSSLQLRAIVVLVVSRQKGITLVFKNDPLESVEVSSSFDGVESVAGFIQREIETQLREAFRSDLPSVIHRLSQKWLSGEVKSATAQSSSAEGGGGRKGPRGGGGGGFEKDAKIETRTAYVAGGGTTTSQGINNKGGKGFTRKMNAPMSEMGESVELDSTWSTFGAGGGGAATPSTRSSSYSRSTPSLSTMRSSRTGNLPVRHDQLDSVPESIEAYDPTYGLRPDSIPHHAGFADYQRLVKAGASKRGLGDVLEAAKVGEEGGRGEPDEQDLYGGHSGERRTGDGSFDFDMIGLRDLVDQGSENRRRSSHDFAIDTDFEPSSFETIPAVGGGTITRPRVFHTQSQIRMRTESSSTGSISAHGTSPSSATTFARSVNGGGGREGGGGSAASTIGLGRAASFARSASLQRISSPSSESEQPGVFSPPSVASTPRFPFPRYPHAPPPAYSARSTAAAPSPLTRNQSMPSFSRYQSTGRVGGGGAAVHRSNLSWRLSSTSTSNELAASRFPPQYTSPAPNVTPLSSPTKSLKPLPTTTESGGGETLSFTRPSPVDLLSRSPSSVLDNSFLLSGGGGGGGGSEDQSLTMMEQESRLLPITLNPVQNDSCQHIKTLSNTNQTLSPFTRENELVMARSSPRPSGPGGASNREDELVTTRKGNLIFGTTTTNTTSNFPPPPIKATRKRLHRIGSAKPPPTSSTTSSSDNLSERGGIPSSSSIYSPPNNRQRVRSLTPTRTTTTIPRSHRKMPSLSGGGIGGVGVGMSSMMMGASRAPSELSDYFPSTGGGSGSAREMLSRFKLS